MRSVWIGVAAVVAVSQGAWAQIIPFPPTTAGAAAGDVFFSNGSVTARATFRVRGSDNIGDAGGKFAYQERGPVGSFRHFYMDVDQVVFTGQAAAFSGRVTFSTDSQWRGKRVVVVVSDGGFPGFGDAISIRASAVNVQPLAMLKVPINAPLRPVGRGDLVVRPRF